VGTFISDVFRSLTRLSYVSDDNTSRVNAGQWSIALSRQQAEQAIAFHHAFAAEHPGLLSDSDIRTGDRRARFAALGRRAFYALNRRRLRLPDGGDG